MISKVFKLRMRTETKAVDLLQGDRLPGKVWPTAY